MFSIKHTAAIAASGLVLMALAGGAQAADLVNKGVVTTAPEPAMNYDDDQFDWSRFYIGAFGSAQDYAGAWEGGGGVLAGVNAQFDFYLLGGEVAISGLTDGNNSRAYGQILGRGGLVITDEMVAYGAAGYGVDFTAGDRHILAGGGLEYAVTDAISVRGQYLHGFANTAASTDTNQITFGLNYHF